MQIRITGVSSVNSDLNRSLSQMVKKLVDEIYLDARQNTPVKTGTARRGWRKEINNQGAIVENKVPYIERLEAGASKQAPKGIIGPTLTQVKGKV